MPDSHKKLIFTGFLSALVIGAGVFAFTVLQKEEPPPPPEPVVEEIPFKTEQKIGRSIQQREIWAYTYGNGENSLLFVGGIHGGYEWNSVILAYQFMDYLEANPNEVPGDISVTVIPDANPDGTFAVIGKEGRFTEEEALASENQELGRFNANDVDLNRNFDCKWQGESTWRGNPVSAGDAPFSEPEAVAIRDIVLQNNPKAVVFWHSQANAVYASECEEGILPETLVVLDTYADAAGYPKVETFDAYPITGDAEGWLASIGIPAVTVELSTHEVIEFEKNLAGATALIDHYSLAK